VNLANAFSSDGEAGFQSPAVDPLLRSDVCMRFELQVAFSGVFAVVVLERPLDVDGVRVVPFNQVGVVAVHRTDEVRERSEKGRGQAAAEAGGFLSKVEREIGECSAMPRAAPDKQGLHQGDEFAPILSRYVRFHGRVCLYSN
jgi:hypothetical protein